MRCGLWTICIPQLLVYIWFDCKSDCVLFFGLSAVSVYWITGCLLQNLLADDLLANSSRRIDRHGPALLPNVLPPGQLVFLPPWVPHRLKLLCNRTLTTRLVSRQCCLMTQHRCGVHGSVTWSVAWPRRSGCFTRSTPWSSPYNPRQQHNCQPRRRMDSLPQPHQAPFLMRPHGQTLTVEGLRNIAGTHNVDHQDPTVVHVLPVSLTG